MKENAPEPVVPAFAANQLEQVLAVGMAAATQALRAEISLSLICTNTRGVVTNVTGNPAVTFKYLSPVPADHDSAPTLTV
ncbi:hypothetical protein D3C77_672280 [compost metagenome]